MFTSSHRKGLGARIAGKPQTLASDPSKSSAVPNTVGLGATDDGITSESALQAILEKELANCRFIAGGAIALLGVDGICCRAKIGSCVPSIGARVDPEAGLTGLCVRSAQVQLCNDIENDPRVDVEVCRSLGLRSLLVLPLKKDGRVLGVIDLAATEVNAFDPALVGKLCRVAEQIIGSAPLEERRPKLTPAAEARGNRIKNNLDL